MNKFKELAAMALAMALTAGITLMMLDGVDRQIQIEQGELQ